MLRMLGGVLIMLGAAWAGLGAAARLRRRTELLESLRWSLGYMEEELSFRLTPLPRLLEDLARERSGPVGRFFQEALEGLSREPEEGLRASWRRAMVTQLGELRQEERQVLIEVGESLGRYDARAQCQALCQGAARMGELAALAREEARRLGRVYAAVALAGGAGLVLVLV